MSCPTCPTCGQPLPIKQAERPAIVDLAFLAQRWTCSERTARRTVARLGIPKAPVVSRGLRFRIEVIQAAEISHEFKPRRKAAK